MSDIALPLSFEPSGDGMGACIHDANGAIICEARYNDFEEDVTRPERAMKMLVEAGHRVGDLEVAVRTYLDFLRRSLNVGPLTNNPTKEAAMLRRMMELVPDAPVSRS